MYETMAQRIEETGNHVLVDHNVTSVVRDGDSIRYVRTENNGGSRTIAGTDFISTMPITDIVLAMDPQAPERVRAAATRLGHRSIVTLNLLADRDEIVPDTWMYVHSPDVRVGRIQFYKNWSQYMVADPSKSTLGLEYFSTEGDDPWNMRDDDLMRLGVDEIGRLGLVSRNAIMEGFVVRMAKACPLYDSAYRECFDEIRSWVSGLRNLVPCGRYGLFRYNNSEHSILSAIYGVKTLLGERSFDVWSVNTAEEYHEEMRPERGSDAPGGRPQGG